jgi:acyl carrier protein
MEKTELLRALDEVFELETGTLQGDEILDDIPTWDSMAMVSVIALADSKSGIKLSPRQIGACTTIQELMVLISPQS